MRNSIKSIIDKLKKIYLDVARYHQHAEEAGAEERIGQLEDEMSSIDQAIEILEEIE